MRQVQSAAAQNGRTHPPDDQGHHEDELGDKYNHKIKRRVVHYGCQNGRNLRSRVLQLHCG